MKILMIDNYDSFTFNLVHYLEALKNIEVSVWKNDQIDFDRVHCFDRIVISPGPGIPSESGQIIPLIQNFSGKKPILGICMGHQAIGEAFGAQLKNLNEVLHGVATNAVIQEKEPIFESLGEKFEIGRYHSWVIDPATLSEDFVVTLKDEKGEIMAIRHKEYDLVGLQFHPESVLTPKGFDMIQNWLRH
ncbi:MAG: aminodeoxychorismate/anthranilate synthase component II [Crocinitomicaceae bacterium]